MVDQTEGWAAGLQLAALSLREAADPVQRATAIRGDDRHLLDYFDAEVLSRATDQQRQLSRALLRAGAALWPALRRGPGAHRLCRRF